MACALTRQHSAIVGRFMHGNVEKEAQTSLKECLIIRRYMIHIILYEIYNKIHRNCTNGRGVYFVRNSSRK